VIGAHRSGIRTVFLPKENEKDLEDIPEEVRRDIEFNFISNYEEIYNRLFVTKKNA